MIQDQFYIILAWAYKKSKSTPGPDVVSFISGVSVVFNVSADTSVDVPSFENFHLILYLILAIQLKTDPRSILHHFGMSLQKVQINTWVWCCFICFQCFSCFQCFCWHICWCPWFWENVWSIPHICHGHHGQCPCKKILSGVKFSRLNAQNCTFYTFWGVFVVILGCFV